MGDGADGASSWDGRPSGLLLAEGDAIAGRGRVSQRVELRHDKKGGTNAQRVPWRRQRCRAQGEHPRTGYMPSGVDLAGSGRLVWRRLTYSSVRLGEAAVLVLAGRRRRRRRRRAGDGQRVVSQASTAE